MGTLHDLFQIFLHLDKHLEAFVHEHGILTYGLLALVVFCETGLVVFPFLPGDSLLFAAGTIAGRGTLDLWAVMGVLIAAAILGDNVNYLIGRTVGHRMLAHPSNRFLNKKNFEKTHAFVEKHGAKAVLLGRFVPIVRTFCPFVAGVGEMDYRRFLIFDTLGALLWVGVCVGAGYSFGHLAIVKNNFELAIVGVVLVSLLPIAIEVVRARLRRPPAETPSGPPEGGS